MRTRRNTLCGIFAVMLALIFTACSNDLSDLPDPTLTGIAAVYNGAAAINVNTPLNNLKANLTVTAQYSNGTTKTVTDYTLSGTLIVGTSTITVSYEGKSTTFTVTTDITYTAMQIGGIDDIADSTGILFTFNAFVGSLNMFEIAISGNTEISPTTTLTGTGTTWTLSPIIVTHAGTTTVRITKTGIEAGTKHVTVYKAGETAPTLTGITAFYNGTAAIYPTTPLNNLKANLTVNAQYTGGSEIELSENEYSLTGTLTVGTSIVTVTYTDSESVTKTTIFPVTVSARTLTGITLNTTSVKKEYAKNEQLDLSGMVVTANYIDGTGATVTGYTTVPANGATLATTGTITVTVNYTEGAVTRTATFIVTVSEENKQYRLISQIVTSVNSNYSVQSHYNYTEWVDSRHYSYTITQESVSGTGKTIYSSSVTFNDNTYVSNSVSESYDNNNEKYASSETMLTYTLYDGANFIQSQRQVTDTIYYATELYPYSGTIDPSHSETITEYTFVELGIINGLTCYKAVAENGSYVIYEASSTGYGVPYTVNQYSYSSSGELTESMEYEAGIEFYGLLIRGLTQTSGGVVTIYSCSNLQINGNLISYDMSYSYNGYTYVTSYVYEVIE